MLLTPLLLAVAVQTAPVEQTALEPPTAFNCLGGGWGLLAGAAIGAAAGAGLGLLSADPVLLDAGGPRGGPISYALSVGAFVCGGTCLAAPLGWVVGGLIAPAEPEPTREAAPVERAPETAMAF